MHEAFAAAIIRTQFKPISAEPNNRSTPVRVSDIQH